MFLYLFWDYDRKLTKVGISIRPMKRMREIATQAGLNLRLVKTYDMCSKQLAERWEARTLEHFSRKGQRVRVNSDYMTTGPIEDRFDRSGIEKFSCAQVIAGFDGAIRSPTECEWVKAHHSEVQGYIDKMLGREQRQLLPEPTTLAALAAAEEEN